MAAILRGDVYWADLNPVRGREQAGQRPVLIVSHNILNERSGTVIALAITSRTPRVGFPLAMQITTVRMSKSSWIKTNQIRTLSMERLGRRIGRLGESELARAVEGLLELIA